jgi:CRP/FNR family transcriptional regulator, polysaccharide utilization system transcription regulator
LKNIIHNCETCGNRPTGIFCDLAGSHLTHLDNEKSVHEFKQGQVIFYEGTLPFALYCIYSGLVKLYKTNKKGDEYILRLLRPGDIVGYQALFENEEYSATAQALETSIVCTIRKETLNSLIAKSPELTLRLLGKLAQELRNSEEQMISFAQDSVRRRTARVLIFLMQVDANSTESSGELSIPLLRREIAQMVGTSPETLSRTMKNFADKGILRLTRSKIYVTNLNALQNIAS